MSSSANKLIAFDRKRYESASKSLCLIAKMEAVNVISEEEPGKKKKILEFHTKFIKKQ